MCEHRAQKCQTYGTDEDDTTLYRIGSRDLKAVSLSSRCIHIVLVESL
ncbi:hypothetical protein Plhal304r1_c021g0075541 [Plasmopara halstedii]